MRGAFAAVLLSVGVTAWAQTGAGALRDYVGVIRQSYHPDVVAYMDTIKDALGKRGMNDAVKVIDEFLKGGFGSGFIFVDPQGVNYIITNYHVITKAYTIAIEFESAAGVKTAYTGLTVRSIDERNDLALLSFAGNEKPFQAGLRLSESPLEEGLAVFSAGFPGLAGTPVWQFGSGIISNMRVTLGAGENDRERGPWIQHTAQIDAGNSGGPLLIREPDAPAAYSVIGVNTASGVRRQAANYAVPVSVLRDFIAVSSRKPGSGELQARLNRRVGDFIGGLNGKEALYTHIAAYLSNECVASNAEYAISEVSGRADKQVQKDIFSKYVFSVIDYSVGWLIAEEFRRASGGALVRPAIGTITSNVDGSQTVPLLFGENKINTIWINEYGLWRVKSAGSVNGIKTARRPKDAEAAPEDAPQKKKPPRTDFRLALSAGYASIGDYGSAADFSLTSKGKGFFTKGLHVFFKPGDDSLPKEENVNFTALEITAGLCVPLRLNKLALSFYAHAAAGIAFHRPDYEYGGAPPELREKPGTEFSFGFSAQGGILFSTAVTGGLFLRPAYQYSNYNPFERRPFLFDHKHSFIISAGYLF